MMGIEQFRVLVFGPRNRRSAHLCPWIGPICLLVIFAGVLSGRDRLAFRDVSYFYTPLYQYVAQQCHDQKWGAFGNAIWNPRDQTGMPLAGETTTAVFYPIRMLVYAPSWSAETAMGVYVVLHLVMASLTAYWAARRFRCDPLSAAVAGVVYPLSGIVLFLATNPPFLVGAAWLPLLLTPLILQRCHRTACAVPLVSRSWARAGQVGRTVVLPAVAMAMIILGGDPPTALHAMIVAVIVQVSRLMIGWARRSYSAVDQARFGVAIIVPMSAVVVLASVLAAPQLAASLAWSARSDRLLHDTAPEISKVHEQAYAFSVPPWRLTELLAPNLYGSPWPINTRWDRIVFDGGLTRPETALWTPSLYCGMLLPVLLVLGWSRRRSISRARFSSDGVALLIIFVFSMAAALGAYAPVYRWLHAFLPGYDSLRYPAKWLPLAAFAIAISSARMVRWHRSVRRREERPLPMVGPSSRSRKIAYTLVSVAFIVVSVMLAVAISRLNGRISDPFWGPFVPDLAGRQLLISMACGGLVVAMILLVRRPRWWLAWVVVDLCIAHYQFVPTIDRAAELRLLANTHHDASSIRSMRVIQDSGFPTQWSEQSAPDRMLTVEAGLRLAKFGRWHVEHEDAVVNNIVSIGSRELAEFWHFAKSMDSADASLPEHHWRGWCRLLGVGGTLRSRGGVVPLTSAASGHALPVVSQERFGAAHEVSPYRVSIRRRIVDMDADRAVAWQKLLSAYADERAEVPAMIPPAMATQFAQGTASGVEMAVVSRPVYQDGNWRAELTPRDHNGPAVETEVFPVDFLSQGVFCPPGKWRLDFYYAPWWQRPMRILALAGWGCILLGYGLNRTHTAMRHRSQLDTQRR